MDELYLVKRYKLKTGDRLVRSKGILSKHHGIFAAYENGVAWIAENQSGKGVQYVQLSEFLLNDPDTLERIEKFNGTEHQRASIVPRINNLLGTSYDLINFNCEHFAEYVQNGKAKSRQVTNTFIGLGLVALGVAIFSTNRYK